MTESHVIYASCKLLKLLSKFLEAVTQFAFLHICIYRNNQTHFSHFLLPCTQCSAVPLPSNWAFNFIPLVQIYCNKGLGVFLTDGC